MSAAPRVAARTPRPPLVDGVDQATVLRVVQGRVWTVRRRPAPYLIPLAVVLAISYAEALFLFWRLPWWVPVLAAVGIAVLAIAITFTVLSARPGRRTYASPDAQLTIIRRRRGWYIADHVARPGTRGAGAQLRRQIRHPLIAAADAQRVVVYAHTKSMKLAHAYMQDIPGMRIASVHGDRILLVRPPRPAVGVNDAGRLEQDRTFPSPR